LIRTGELCKSCNNSCHADPATHGEIEIDCVNCNDGSCGKCNYGKFGITDCPKKIIDYQTLDVIKMSDAKDEGHLAIAGGIIDQSVSLMAAIEFYKSDVSKIEAAKY
jgi:hypothetical protein